jgi:mRNA interferase RelE/StbE
MAWKVELSATAERELSKLDTQHSKRILKFLKERIAKLDNPRSVGKALQGSRVGEFWKYRLGDFRLICKIEDKLLLVLVLRIGDRKEIYRKSFAESIWLQSAGARG